MKQKTKRQNVPEEEYTRAMKACEILPFSYHPQKDFCCSDGTDEKVDQGEDGIQKTSR